MIGPMPTEPPDHRRRPAAPGHDAQGEALGSLRSVLDRSAAAIEAARAERDRRVSAARGSRDLALREAAETLEATLARIERQAQETRDEVRQRHEAKLAVFRREREAELELAKQAHKKATAKAKQKREEAVWLADAVLESATPKIRNAFEGVRGQASELAGALDELERELVRLLGPKHTERVAGAVVPEPHVPDAPTVDGLNAAVQAARDAVGGVAKGGALRAVRGKARTQELGTRARDLIAEARVYAEALIAHAGLARDSQLADAGDVRKKEIELADRGARLAFGNADRTLGQAVREHHDAVAQRTGELEARRDRDLNEVARWEAEQSAKARSAHDDASREAADACDSVLQEAEAACATVEARCEDEAVRVTGDALRALSEIEARSSSANPAWASEAWASRPHPRETSGVVPFADGALDLGGRLDRINPLLTRPLDVERVVRSPIVLGLPGPRSLLISHDAGGRDAALGTLRDIMLRVLTSFPAGKVRFTMADPIGLGQSFAGFMRLADMEPSPVGLRIWSDPNQIERQLVDLTEHMQTVIQKYLRADYDTIEDYNRAAGEIAEPYRFVIIADLPSALTESGAARLASILESGPRCGVYALLAMETGAKLPPALTGQTLQTHAVRLALRGGHAKIEDPRFDEAVLTLESEPSDGFAGTVLDRVAKAGVDAGRVEVPFDRLVPADDALWSRTTDEELSVPLGRSGAQKIQQLRLGSGTRQHALIAGRTGSGKSTLLHVMITAAALWHSPDELEIYLIDFKKGVEFKAYATGRVPHVRAVAIESDREFGLSVLKRLDEELTARGDLFRKIGAQNLAAARRLDPSTPLPRIMLLIDEFQEFFTEDDEVASEATLLLDRLVRQGRAFGVHVILGSQTLAGAYSLARSTLGQIGVRIALQCSEADSYLILGEDNNAARLLTRPGEAIYNDAGGLIEANSPFQTAWLPDADREAQLARLPEPDAARPAPVVFEGNAPARLDRAARALALAFPDRSVPRVLLGDAVAIAPPVAATLRRRSGANLIVVGPTPEPALGMLVAGATSAGSAGGVRTIWVDPTPEDDALFGVAGSALAPVGAEVRTHRDVDAVITEIDTLVRGRQSGGGGQPVVLVLAGLHRLRTLRKSDSYSFSLDDDTGVSPDKQLANILREGPSVGVWTLAWCDSLTNLERAMERSTVREFGLRVLMQMGASDSAALIDSSAAANLGVNRALLADDEAGTITRFRPVDLPSVGMVRAAVGALRGDGG